MDSETRMQVLSFCIGGFAGCAAKTTVAPIDRVKILLQGHNPLYHNVRPLLAFFTVAKRDGLLGFYQGNGAQMIRIFPYAAIQYFSYGKFKKMFETCGWSWDHGLEKLLCGALAGMSAAVCTYPLDLARARLAFESRNAATGQTTVHKKGRRIIFTLMNIVKSEGGIRALYRGLSATLLGMAPYAGISFFIFEHSKTFLIKAASSKISAVESDQWSPWIHLLVTVPDETASSSSTVHLNAYGRLVCGALAGLVAQTIAYPLDVTRRRMQLNAAINPHNQSSSSPWFRVLWETFQKYGVTYGLYRGVTLNFIRVTPMVAVSFSTYETLCHWAEIPTST